MNKRIDVIVTEEDDDVRVDRWFKRHYPQMQHGHLQKLLRKKDIRVEGKRADASQRLSKGYVVTLPSSLDGLEEREDTPTQRVMHTAAQLEAFRKCIIFEDQTLLVINKLSGLAVQGGSGIAQSVDSFCQAIWIEQDVRPKLVHRLDKDTSGVLILAKTTKMASLLTRAFKDREIKKDYIALVKNVPFQKEGFIDFSLAKIMHGGQEKMQVDQQNGKKARTFYEVLDNVGKEMALVQLSPVTGRTHQLRVHMAAIDCPIIGDGKYGGRDAFVDGIGRSLHLHAQRLEIPQLRKTYECELPKHMRESCRYLGLVG